MNLQSLETRILSVLFAMFYLSSYVMAKEKGRVIAGVVPLTTDGRFVLISNRGTNKHKLLFPKGGVEKGENLHEAALREAKEEAGLEGFIFKEELVCKNGIHFFILYVFNQMAVYDEADKRIRIELTREQLLENEAVVEYVKEIVLHNLPNRA